MPVLEYKKVSKDFGSIHALKNVSFKVDEGEFLFITGPSGSGKTTLLRLLIRLVKPSSGKIVFDGDEVNNVKRSKIPALRRKIGAVFQDFRLIAERTIRENCEIALAIDKIPKKEWQNRVDHVLDLVGLSERSELFPSQLSGGELQRAALARALVVNPKIVFADEPTGNLDWDTAEGIMGLLKKINDEGKTVIVTTHHKKIIREYSKRVLELSKGELKSDSSGTKNSKSKK